MGSSKVSQPFHSGLIIINIESRMILTGLAGIIIIEIYAAVMQRCFQDTDNRVGKGFAILGIYAFVVVYCTVPSFFLLSTNQWHG